MLDTVNEVHHEFESNYIRFPKAEGAALLVLGSVKKNQPFHYSKTGNTISIDQASGEILDYKIIEKTSANNQLASISRAIHFVEFDNIFIKILFCLAGLTVPLLSIMGFLLWKWKAKGPDQLN